MGIRALITRLLSRSPRLEAEVPRQTTVTHSSAGAHNPVIEGGQSAASVTEGERQPQAHHESYTEAARQRRQQYERIHGDWTSD